MPTTVVETVETPVVVKRTTVIEETTPAKPRDVVVNIGAGDSVTIVEERDGDLG